MLHRLRGGTAIRAEIVVDVSHSVPVIHKPGTVARAKLSEGGTSCPRKRSLLRADKRRTTSQNPIWRESVDGLTDDDCMKIIHYGLAAERVHNPLLVQKRADILKKFRLKRMFHWPRPPIQRNNRVRRVMTLKRAGEELRREETQV